MLPSATRTLSGGGKGGIALAIKVEVDLIMLYLLRYLYKAATLWFWTKLKYSGDTSS